MPYIQKINQRDKDNQTSFRNEGFVPVSKDPRTNVTTYKNPKGEIRLGIPGPDGTIKTLRKNGEPYTGKK
jgi:hypothetical protein|tara:strand:+ start:61 stop:270 length:210 start_codon:yes stop_codon:yes gene_type:complete